MKPAALTVVAAALALLLAAGCGSGTNSGDGHGTNGIGLAGTYVMNISKSEMEKAHVENWGYTRLVLGEKRFRISDRRAPDQRPLVQGYSKGWTSGTYSVRGNRLTFFIGSGYGDTPLGKFPDPPIVVRWSLYRNTLTFQQGKKVEGGASTWLKPWRKVSESPTAKPTATGFPTGTFETKSTPADLRNTAFPLRNAHWETLTFKNRTWRDVWFHPRRADQPVAGGRYVVHGNELTLLSVHDVVRWNYYRGQLTFRIVDVADAFGRFTYTVHPWRRVS